MWHKQSFTQFWSQSDAYSRRSSLKLTYIHHPLVVCTHQICCAVAVPIALSQDRLLHGHNRLVNWTPCSRMRESKLKRHHRDVNQWDWALKCSYFFGIWQVAQQYCWQDQIISEQLEKFKHQSDVFKTSWNLMISIFMCATELAAWLLMPNNQVMLYILRQMIIVS